MEEFDLSDYLTKDEILKAKMLARANVSVFAAFDNVHLIDPERYKKIERYRNSRKTRWIFRKKNPVRQKIAKERKRGKNGKWFSKQ